MLLKRKQHGGSRIFIPPPPPIMNSAKYQFLFQCDISVTQFPTSIMVIIRVYTRRIFKNKRISRQFSHANFLPFKKQLDRLMHMKQG